MLLNEPFISSQGCKYSGASWGQWARGRLSPEIKDTVRKVRKTAEGLTTLLIEQQGLLPRVGYKGPKDLGVWLHPSQASGRPVYQQCAV